MIMFVLNIQYEKEIFLFYFYNRESLIKKNINIKYKKFSFLKCSFTLGSVK